MRDPVLWLHVTAGAVGLLTGPLWLAARLRGRRGDGLAWAYQVAVSVVAASGGVLAEARREVDVRQTHRDEFGYLALVLRAG